MFKKGVFLSVTFRRLWYKRYFDSIGNGLYVVGRPVITGSGKIKAGDHLSLISRVRQIELNSVEKDSIISIGNNVLLSPGVTIVARKKIELGNHTLVGRDTIIWDSDWHGYDGQPRKDEAVKIGDHVWICSRVEILRGVSIGDNAIVGAGSVVTHDIPPNTLVAGNPAKKIRSTSGYEF